MLSSTESRVGGFVGYVAVTLKLESLASEENVQPERRVFTTFSSQAETRSSTETYLPCDAICARSACAMESRSFFTPAMSMVDCGFAPAPSTPAGEALCTCFM